MNAPSTKAKLKVLKAYCAANSIVVEGPKNAKASFWGAIEKRGECIKQSKGWPPNVTAPKSAPMKKVHPRAVVRPVFLVRSHALFTAKRGNGSINLIRRKSEYAELEPVDVSQAPCDDRGVVDHVSLYNEGKIAVYAPGHRHSGAPLWQPGGQPQPKGVYSWRVLESIVPAC